MSKRFVLVVAHTGRTDAVTAAQVAIEQLHAAGISPVLTATDLEDLRSHVSNQVLNAAVLENIKVLDTDCKMTDLELVVVLGGDGTILKAAEIVREHSIPLMGINLGHVGFLAESEREEFAEALRSVGCVVSGRLRRRLYDRELQFALSVDTCQRVTCDLYGKVAQNGVRRGGKC